MCSLPGHELVQYGMQGSGANSGVPRGPPRSREREDQYGRREWPQGQQHPDYDVVQHLFNGWDILMQVLNRIALNLILVMVLKV